MFHRRLNLQDLYDVNTNRYKTFTILIYKAWRRSVCSNMTADRSRLEYKKDTKVWQERSDFSDRCPWLLTGLIVLPAYVQKMINYQFVWYMFPDSKVHEAYVGPTWGRQEPGGHHIGPMNLAIRVWLELSRHFGNPPETSSGRHTDPSDVTKRGCC